MLGVLHDVTADDLGIALVPWPIEIGDEIAVDGHPWRGGRPRLGAFRREGSGDGEGAPRCAARRLIPATSASGRA
jgi:hypothetical protein